MSAAGPTPEDLRQTARKHWGQGQPSAALDGAWAAFDLAPAERSTKRLLAGLLEHHPTELQPERRAGYLKLLTDLEVEPDPVSTAGWQLVLSSHDVTADRSPPNFESLVSAIKRDTLAIALLGQSPVYFAPAERLLTLLRRWLLLSGQWQQHPEILEALRVQMRLNGGAWPFDETERAQLAKPEISAMISAYLPERSPSGSATAEQMVDPVTRAVTAQYEGWPYPAWTRITVSEKRRLADVIRQMDPEAAEALPVAANMLVAGCGTGRQAAHVAYRYPDATITAIDVSEASLDYARRRCGASGIKNVRFLKLDLHDVAQLGQRFHAIHSAGVLHHLPDPERGFKVLAGVLHRGGVMHIMVYNRAQRLTVAAARTLIGDLMREPVTDDLLRQVRARLLAQPDASVASGAICSRDFATLVGTHDLLLHRHEDSFDTTRIERALDQAGLRLLSFDLPTPPVAARYNAMFPDDPKHQNIKSWSRFSRADPYALASHYRFWCSTKSV